MIFRPKRKNKKFKSPGSKKLIFIDAFINNFFYKLKYYFLEGWNVSSIILSRMELHGFSRFILELFETFLNGTLVVIMLVSLYGTAILEITKTDWKHKDNFSVTFLNRYGGILGQRGVMSAESVPIDEIPPYVIKAVLATEDRRFYNHIGLDFWGLSRALMQNVQHGGVVQGGSTLTQQLAKNLFLTNKRTLVRKIKEAILALWFEVNFSKKEILQKYLNNAYMGGGNFGINAASQFYFGKDIRKVSLAEAAILAGLFKAPSKYAPHIHPEASKERTEVVLNNLVNSGYMNESEVEEARRHPAVIIASTKSSSPEYFLDYAYDQLKKMNMSFPYPHIIVQTTLDSQIQQTAEKALNYYLDNFGTSYHVSQGAVVVLANNGGIRAMVGGKDYDESHFNRAVNGLRQVGSSFKPYVYAEALEAGLTPDSVVLDAPITWGNWSPHNDNNRYLGPITLTTALVYSINTVAVRLAYQYLHRNVDCIYNLVKSMGIAGQIAKHKTMVLGTSSMSTLDQATGYNVFANGGMAGNRHIFLKVSTPDGRVLWKYDEPKMYRVLSAQSTAYLNQMLYQAVQRGTGHRAAIEGIAIAGKTGTTQNFRDAWFCGFSGNFSTAVWMGNDNYKPTERLFGGILPAMIFHEVMKTAQNTTPIKPLYGVINNYNQAATAQKENTEYSAVGILSPDSTTILRNLSQDLRYDK